MTADTNANLRQKAAMLDLISDIGFVCAFARAETPKHLKIGWARNPFLRSATLRAGNDELCVMGWFHGTRSKKFDVLRRFAEFKIRGEWFADVDGLILQYFHTENPSWQAASLSDSELDKSIEQLRAEAANLQQHADALKLHMQTRQQPGSAA